MSSQSVPDRLLDGAHGKTVLRTMRHMILVRYFCLCTKLTMALVTVMLGCLIVGSFIFAKDTSPCLLLPWDPNGSIVVRMRGRFRRSYFPDLGYRPFTIIFELNFGQEVTPIFVVQGTIFLLFILKLIKHGWGESSLNWNSNIINRELFVAEFSIRCFIIIALHQRGRGKCFAKWCISWTRLAYQRIPTQNGFTMSL